ncbi:hypothetical protein Micbo1qcDRAFT_141570 [Microdochium bolleyi]|uniref:Uncharacterized protein n=1 Tax=Microdochium bolleyi TaxID=196109 RepID=A0A136IKF2_9PEZI|nr:hypothetical protein Micbo1qcDRAFT_141570 [Microdochium bolleyi]
MIAPLPPDDPLRKSAYLQKINTLGNPVIADICIKRLPLASIRPELQHDQALLVTEFARGVWAGWAFAPQRWLFTRIFRSPENSHLKFSQQEIRGSTFEVGTEFIDQFEVVERTPTSVVVREGGSPRQLTPREVDGLITTSVRIDREAGEVELALSTILFKGRERVLDGSMPVPYPIELLHYMYARALVQSGSQALR